MGTVSISIGVSPLLQAYVTCFSGSSEDAPPTTEQVAGFYAQIFQVRYKRVLRNYWRTTPEREDPYLGLLLHVEPSLFPKLLLQYATKHIELLQNPGETCRLVAAIINAKRPLVSGKKRDLFDRRAIALGKKLILIGVRMLIKHNVPDDDWVFALALRHDDQPEYESSMLGKHLKQYARRRLLQMSRYISDRDSLSLQTVHSFYNMATRILPDRKGEVLRTTRILFTALRAVIWQASLYQINPNDYPYVVHPEDNEYDLPAIQLLLRTVRNGYSKDIHGSYIKIAPAPLVYCVSRLALQYSTYAKWPALSWLVQSAVSTLLHQDDQTMEPLNEALGLLRAYPKLIPLFKEELTAKRYALLRMGKVAIALLLITDYQVPRMSLNDFLLMLESVEDELAACWEVFDERMTGDAKKLFDFQEIAVNFYPHQQIRTIQQLERVRDGLINYRTRIVENATANTQC